MQNGKVVPLTIGRNAVTHAPHIKIRYEDNKEIRTFFDQFGHQTKANGVYREVYSLDDLGQRTSMYFENESGERTESNWGVYEYKWEVDKRGTVTENRFDLEGKVEEIRPGFPFYCLKLHYDQRGYLAMMENYGKDCSQLTKNKLNGAQDRLIYNAHGFMEAWNVYDDNEQRIKGNSPNVAIGKMEHDSFGNTTREYYLDEKRLPISNAYGWFDSRAKFDQHGNMISRFNYDEKGQKANNPNLGYAGYVLTYDQQGLHRISIAYFDKNNIPVNHMIRGYHSALTEYDMLGRKRKITYLDKTQSVVNRKDNGIAVITFNYAKNHTQPAITYFDSENRQLVN
ncbi:MAG: hypothetical protein ACPG5R_05065 [Cognaticolwellia aestuarii]